MSVGWSRATAGFGTYKDALYNTFFGAKAIEGSSTQYAERLGFRIGSQMREAEINDELRRRPSYGGLPKIKVSNSIMIRSDYTPWK